METTSNGKFKPSADGQTRSLKVDTLLKKVCTVSPMFNFSGTTDVHCQVVGRLVARKPILSGPISRPVAKLKTSVPCLLGTVRATVFLSWRLNLLETERALE